MCEIAENDVLKKYIILSEVAIYKDILPDYKIRLPTEVLSHSRYSLISRMN